MECRFHGCVFHGIHEYSLARHEERCPKRNEYEGRGADVTSARKVRRLQYDSDDYRSASSLHSRSNSVGSNESFGSNVVGVGEFVGNGVESVGNSTMSGVMEASQKTKDIISSLAALQKKVSKKKFQALWNL